MWLPNSPWIGIWLTTASAYPSREGLLFANACEGVERMSAEGVEAAAIASGIP